VLHPVEALALAYGLDEPDHRPGSEHARGAHDAQG